LITLEYVLNQGYSVRVNVENFSIKLRTFYIVYLIITETDLALNKPDKN